MSTMSHTLFATLDSVDAIKHKLTDAEYKSIVENLQQQHAAVTKHFTIQYQVTQCWNEKVSGIYHADLAKDIVRLATSESTHTAIVRMKPSDRYISMHPADLLPALRMGEVYEGAILIIQEDIEKHGFYHNAATEQGECGGPWAGVRIGSDRSDVMTKIMVVKCDEYTV